ncbi:MAG TPA: type II toxin-antitoxin system RelE/ParE family toxin [Nodosilinea sp.]|nr:type II toxin-antitoxin system RelE/ParE family toxin [Nodosilinea sp.]
MDRIAACLRQAINTLQANPCPAGVKKLTGEANFYRIRAGDFRVIGSSGHWIIYAINNEAKRLLVAQIRQHRDVYQERDF